MPVPSDLCINERIALAKGWSTIQVRIGALPNFVGTLEGVAGLMRELQEEQDRKNEARLYRTDARLIWSWTYLPDKKEYLCILENEVGYEYEAFVSPSDRPGDCVGNAYLSMKEAADARK